MILQTPAVSENVEKPETVPPSPPSEDIRNVPNSSDLSFPIADTWRLGNPHFSSDSEDDSESTGAWNAYYQLQKYRSLSEYS